MANPSRVVATVQSIESFGRGIYKVDFSIPSRYTRFLPGQFLHLTLEEVDPTDGFWPESRVFSIASAPRKDSLSIVYSVKGSYTFRMERELAVGRNVWLKLPYGHFVIEEGVDVSGDIVLIAGGTGISPFIPYLLNLSSSQRTVHLFYGVRNPEQVLFLEQLVSLTKESWFKLHLFVEEGTLLGITSSFGKLSLDEILKELGSEKSAMDYYLSGPPGMIQNFRMRLETTSIPPGNIHFDDWE